MVCLVTVAPPRMQATLRTCGLELTVFRYSENFEVGHLLYSVYSEVRTL